MKYHVALTFLCLVAEAQAWQPGASSARATAASSRHDMLLMDRRDFFQQSAVSVVAFTSATAAAKPGRAENKLSKDVQVSLDVVPTGRFPMAVNGAVLSSSEETVAAATASTTAAQARLSYQLPPSSSWDDSSPSKSTVILAYQKTGTASYDGLEKAAQGSWKVARALDVGDRFPAASGLKQRLNQATLLAVTDSAAVKNGSDSSLLRTVDFDLGSSESSFFIRATVLDQRLYVFLLEATGDDKVLPGQAREEMRRVRSSFRVERAI